MVNPDNPAVSPFVAGFRVKTNRVIVEIRTFGKLHESGWNQGVPKASVPGHLLE
jgi:hypothetical protein